METIKDKKYGGERPLFGAQNIRLLNVVKTLNVIILGFMANIRGGM